MAERANGGDDGNFLTIDLIAIHMHAHKVVKR
jgi:hypothetical protein